MFKSYDYDFYKIDPALFAPAAISVTNRKTGKTYKSGFINCDVLIRSIEFEILK
ncbi:MAG TPA: hypothetical protein EYP16_03920 [Candidatus Atribacteria bacterium]|nr:hypothetical protein [Candidatus Atribacteria bacterium]